MHACCVATRDMHNQHDSNVQIHLHVNCEVQPVQFCHRGTVPNAGRYILLWHLSTTHARFGHRDTTQIGRVTMRWVSVTCGHDVGQHTWYSARPYVWDRSSSLTVVWSHEMASSEIDGLYFSVRFLGFAVSQRAGLAALSSRWCDLARLHDYTCFCCFRGFRAALSAFFDIGKSP